MTEPLGPPPSSRIRRPVGGRYAVALAATVVCWAALVGGLVYLIFARTAWAHQADQAHLREWLDEARVFRKTIPDLVADYIDLRDKGFALTDEDVARKTGEIREQLKSLTDPLRMYQGYLPLFPDVFRVEVVFPRTDWPAISWESPVPRPRPQSETTVDVLEYPLPNRPGDRALLRCEYKLHAFNQRQRE